jgi:hypothetical protein
MRAFSAKDSLSDNYLALGAFGASPQVIDAKCPVQAVLYRGTLT